MKLRRIEKPRGWTSIPNATLEDARLSWRARGILAYLLSRPEGWDTDSERLAAIAKEGRDAVRSALRELETHRYLFRVKAQGMGGLWSTEYVLYDTPLDPRITPGAQPPLDLDALAEMGENPGDNPGDNSVETGGEPTTENPSPAPEKPTTGNPALLTTKDQQLKKGHDATTEADGAPMGADSPIGVGLTAAGVAHPLGEPHVQPVAIVSDDDSGTRYAGSDR